MRIFAASKPLIALAALLGSGIASVAQTPATRVDEALQNITTIARTGRIGYATFWDGNRYVQCRRTVERELRCEAAGVSMQPALRHVLTPERLARLAAQGWMLDPSFGNYVKTLPAGLQTRQAADHILRALTDAYGADAAKLEVQTAWVIDMPCPPRNGYSQNLAGIVNDAPSMRATAAYGCSYKASAAAQAQPAETPEGLFALYGASMTAELQRLRINMRNRVYVVFNAGIGYTQCMPQPSPPAIYCEAQSAESWPALAAVLTPERVAKLRAAGYADPGRGPNYWKAYPLDVFNDEAIARELLAILHDVYGYAGAAKLDISPE